MKNQSVILLITCWISGISSLQGQDLRNEFQLRFDSIENNAYLPDADKLTHLIRLQHEIENAGIPPDTLSSKIYHILGLYEFTVHKNYLKGIAYTLEAARINRKINSARSIYLAAGNYFNLGYFYDQAQQSYKSLACYDTAFILSEKVPGRVSTGLDAALGKANIYFKSGDYQKELDEANLGIFRATQAGDSIRMLDFLNHSTQGYFYQNQLPQAITDVERSIELAKILRQPYRLASAYKMKGFIYAQSGEYAIAETAFKSTIHTRLMAGDAGQVAGDYNDLGNFYRDHVNDLKKADINYAIAAQYAEKEKDSIRLARISINRAYTGLLQGNLQHAGKYLSHALLYLLLPGGHSLLQNPPLTTLGSKALQELIFVVFECKTSYLLEKFKHTGDKDYLNACIQTALFTDSIITGMRNNQFTEQSKLYWRSRTRGFFSYAVEACYLAKDAQHAFFFMEKSKAVVLNDQISESGAGSLLPPSERDLEQEYISRLLNAQMQLEKLSPGSENVQSQQEEWLQLKKSHEEFVHSLETRYPLYYQYKYASDPPTLARLQDYLRKQQSTFVHYFSGDSILYVLKISGKDASIFRLTSGDADKNNIAAFTQWCSGKQQLNNQFEVFASLAQELYQRLVAPVNLQEGRVILSFDHFFLPFEILMRDKHKHDYLLYHYLFSYVYSAQYLLKSRETIPAKGDFIGFAPASFNRSLGVPPLRHSIQALQKLAKHYFNAKLFTGATATRHRFITEITQYNIIGLFSHALSDSATSQPLLYMQDSVISLSDLQLIRRPATQLVMLNACETNIGKVATGEGIYSLTRGFSALGIHAVSSTIWKADEETIYNISEKFNEYIIKGIPKDKALQLAKIEFIRENDLEKQLPYYWGNIILTGNTNPVLLIKSTDSSSYNIIIPPLLLVLATGIIFFFFKRRKSS